MSDIRARIEKVIKEYEADDPPHNAVGVVPLTPEDIAYTLVDQDVSQGLYEGCTSGLESWWCQYVEHAKQLLNA